MKYKNLLLDLVIQEMKNDGCQYEDIHFVQTHDASRKKEKESIILKYVEKIDDKLRDNGKERSS